MKLILSVEATCDLTPQLISAYDLTVFDMKYSIDGVEYSTATDTVQSSGLYEKMRNGAVTRTSQINENYYEEYFSELSKQGVPIVHVALSSGLSGTVQSAALAAELLNRENGSEIYVVDSLCACAGQGLLAVLGRRFAEQAQSAKEVADYLEKIRWKVQNAFSVDNLRYLANGGRLKASKALIGNILKIKPMMYMDNEGHLAVQYSVISRRKALKEFVKNYAEQRDPSGDLCFISHAGCPEDAEYIREGILEKTGVRCEITDLGPVIGAHSGPGTIAVFYLAKQR